MQPTPEPPEHLPVPPGTTIPPWDERWIGEPCPNGCGNILYVQIPPNYDDDVPEVRCTAEDCQTKNDFLSREYADSLTASWEENIHYEMDLI